MDYLLFKALHIAAIIVWIGGMLVATVTLSVFSALPLPRGENATRAIAIVRNWDRRITTPTMLAAWALGLYLAVSAGLFYEGWLNVKLLFVIVLSGLHGMLSGGLRRLYIDPERQPSKHTEMYGPIILVSIMLIAYLVVAKPF